MVRYVLVLLCLISVNIKYDLPKLNDSVAITLYFWTVVQLNLSKLLAVLYQEHIAWNYASESCPKKNQIPFVKQNWQNQFYP